LDCVDVQPAAPNSRMEKVPRKADDLSMTPNG
jgi:hypothetical protein